jgi:hypothetical protein
MEFPRKFVLLKFNNFLQAKITSSKFLPALKSSFISENLYGK